MVTVAGDVARRVVGDHRRIHMRYTVPHRRCLACIYIFFKVILIFIYSLSMFLCF
jgi:hypothetical protein